MIKNEIEIMNKLNHPNIIKYEELLYNQEKEVYGI